MEINLFFERESEKKSKKRKKKPIMLISVLPSTFVFHRKIRIDHIFAVSKIILLRLFVKNYLVFFLCLFLFPLYRFSILPFTRRWKNALFIYTFGQQPYVCNTWIYLWCVRENSLVIKICVHTRLYDPTVIID